MTCAMGKTSSSWYADSKGPRGKLVIQSHFAKRYSNTCEARNRSTRSAVASRCVAFHPMEQFHALQAARERQKTPSFQAVYTLRSGIEGAISKLLANWTA